MNTIKRFLKEEDGLETIEYAVMTALIVALLVTAIKDLSGSAQDRFGEVEGVIDGIAP